MRLSWILAKPAGTVLLVSQSETTEPSRSFRPDQYQGGTNNLQLRPIDSSGDILPVTSSSSMLKGPEATAQLVQYRLSLLQGEWWENPTIGFPILESMQSSRLTETDASALASMISSYIRETPGVQDVDDVRYAVAGRLLSFSCTVRTKDGTAEVSYAAD